MFLRPTLQTLIDRIEADIEARLPGTDAGVRRTVFNTLARVHAGAMHSLYGYLDYLSKQVIYTTAEAEYLEQWSAVWGVQRVQAGKAVGNVTFTGTNGVVVPAGTIVQNTAGWQYRTNVDGTIASGAATIAVTALLGGVAGNAVVATVLSLVQPISGIGSTATVATGGLTNGSEVETDSALRARLLSRVQTTPHGGAVGDYVAWALSVSGVTRAWCFPLYAGAGTVGVTFVRDNDVTPIPDSAEVAAVQAYIDSVRPVTAAVTVYAPTAVPLNLTIAVVPNTQAVKDAVTAEIKDLLKRSGAPYTWLYLSQINEAISLAVGETDHTLTVPSANIFYTNAQIATLGTITWA